MFSKQRSLRSIMVLRNSRKQLSTNNWKMEKFKHFPLIKKMLKIIHNLIIILILMVLDIISKINKFLRILFLFLESKLVSINLFFIWFPLKNKVVIIFFVYQLQPLVCWSLYMNDWFLMKKNSQMKAFEF